MKVWIKAYALASILQYNQEQSNESSEDWCAELRDQLIDSQKESLKDLDVDDLVSMVMKGGPSIHNMSLIDLLKLCAEMDSDTAFLFDLKKISI